MLKYKILLNGSGNTINIPLKLESCIYNDIDDTIIDNLTSKEINEYINYEKELYESTQSYNLMFKFFNESYDPLFDFAGFEELDYQKNAFKKSFFLLEFYDNNISTNTRKFSTTLSVYPNLRGGKGCDIDVIDGKKVYKSTFTVNKPKNELFLISNYRDLLLYNNVISDGTKKYILMYVKIMFLNAKTGNIHYFINSEDDEQISINDFNDTLYYYEIRFYDDFTYGFYKDNMLKESIVFKELIIK